MCSHNKAGSSRIFGQSRNHTEVIENTLPLRSILETVGRVTEVLTLERNRD